MALDGFSGPLPGLNAANIGIANSPNPGFGDLDGLNSAASAPPVQVASNDPTTSYAASAAQTTPSTSRNTQIAQTSPLPVPANGPVINPASVLPAQTPPTNNSLIIKPGTSGGSNLSAIGQNAIKNFLDQSKNLPALNDQVTITSQQFGTAINGLMSASEQSQEVIHDAYHKIGIGQFVPQKIARILGVFGLPDYDIDYQKSRIQQSVSDLQAKNLQATTLGTAAQVAASLASRANEAQTAAVSTAATISRDAREQALLGIQQQQAKMQRAQFLAEGIPDEQLDAAIKNPELYQKQNPDISVGMLQGIQKARKAKDIALSTAALANTHQGMENELERQKVLEASRTSYVSALSSADLFAQAAQSKKDGYVDIPLPGKDAGNLRIPDIYYSSYIAALQTKQNEQAKQNLDVNTASLTNSTTNKQLIDTTSRLNDDTITGNTPPEKLRDAVDTVNTATALSGDTSPAGILARQEMLKQGTAKVNGIIDEAVKTLDATQQPLVRQHINTGYTNSKDVAGNYLGTSMIQAFSPLPFNDLYYPADSSIRKMVNEATKTADYPSLGLFGGKDRQRDGSVSDSNVLAVLAGTPKDKPSTINKFNEVLTKPAIDDNGNPVTNPQTGKPVTVGENAKATVLQQAQQMYIHNTVSYLGNLGGGAFGQLLSGNDIAPQFKTKDGQINLPAIYEFLASKDAADPTGQAKNLEALRGKLNDPGWRQNFDQWERKTFSRPDHTAWRQLLFDNNVSGAVAAPLVRDIEQVERTYSAVQAKKAQAATEAEAMSNPYYRAGNVGTNAPNFEDAVAAAKGLYSMSPTLQTRNLGPVGANPNLPLSPSGLRAMQEYGKGGITPYPTNRPPGIPPGAIWNGSAWVWYPDQSNARR